MIQLLHYSLTIPYGKTLLPQTRPEPVQTALSSAPRLPSLPGSGSAGPIPPRDPQAFESLQIYPDPDIMFWGHLLICIDMLTVAICDMRLQMSDLYCRSPKASAVEPVARMRSPGKVPERPLRSLKRLYLLWTTALFTSLHNDLMWMYFSHFSLMLFKMHWAKTIWYSFMLCFLVDSSQIWALHFSWPFQLWGLTCNLEASRMARHRFAAWAPSQTLRSCSTFFFFTVCTFEHLQGCEKTHHTLVKPYSTSVATGCLDVGIWLS